MLQIQSDLLSAFVEVNSSAPNYEGMKETIRKNAVDLRYCRFYPLNYPYQSLALARSGFTDSTTTSHEGEASMSAPQFWKVVEHCPQEGMLQDLRDGRLDAWVRDKPPPGYEDTSTVKKLDETIVSLPLGEARLAEPSTGTAEAQDDNRAESGDPGMREWPLKHISLSDGGLEDSESDGGVILNLQPRRYINKSGPLSSQEKSEVLKVVDEVWDENGNDADSEGKSEDSESDMENDSRSENGDAMMDYSNSEQATAEQVSHQQEKDRADTDHNVRLLRDLSPQDLNAQLRYFHVTKMPADVSQDTPVRCLVCAEEGHMAAVCASLTCATCGAYSQHTTRLCPQTIKCSKCRELHGQSSCPYKLKNIASSEILCDLCQRTGHAEGDCELLWRTSGRPWESKVGGNRVRLTCYECGRSGHSGNDCPTRKPGKTLGTSTWGSGNAQASIRSKGQISIKGRATQQEPIVLDDSEDELANFHRPKMPLPARKGQIKISAASSQHAPSQGSQAAYNESYGHNTVRSGDSGYRDDRDNDRGRERRRAEDNYKPSYGTNERRSISPPYHDYGRDYRSDWYPLPPPQAAYQHQRPPANANVYRPMPSSAQNAWSRHRV